MIRNDREYNQAVLRLRAERERIEEQERALKAMPELPADKVKRAMDPLWSFHLQLQEEVQSYERLRRKDFSDLANFDDIGKLLIGLRIASGMNQRQLADRLKIAESQVSRDERNEYNGITKERIFAVLQALGAELEVRVVQGPSELPIQESGSRKLLPV